MYQDESYWQGFYRAEATQSLLNVPSQFSVFAASELIALGIETVVEFGCGNGRDAFLFNAQGFRTVAVDGSAAAIESIRERSRQEIMALQLDVSTPLPERLHALEGPKALYGRFFLHALTDEELEKFAENCGQLAQAGDPLFFEYRIDADEALQKETAAHFRAFRPASAVAALFAAQGFDLTYEVQGQGFAKYKADDANVARQIFTKA